MVPKAYPANRGGVFPAACAMYGVAGMAATFLGPLYPFLVMRFAIGLADAGLFTSIEFIGSCAGCILGGHWLGWRWPVRAVYGVGLGAGGLGSLLLWAAPSIGVAWISLVLVGLAHGVLVTASNLVVVSVYGVDRGPRLNLLNVFFGAAAGLAPLLSAFFVAMNCPLALYGVFAGVCLLAWRMAWSQGFALEATERTASPMDRRGLLSLLPFGAFLFLYIGAEIGIGSWLTVHVSAWSSSASVTAPLVAASFWIALMVGRLGGSYGLARWPAEQRLLAGALVIVAVGTALILLGQGVVGWIGAVLAGAGCGPIFPTTLAFVARVNAAFQGRTAGLFVAGTFLGAAVLPYVQGRWGHGTSGGMEVSLAAVGGMALILVSTFGHGDRQFIRRIRVWDR